MTPCTLTPIRDIPGWLYEIIMLDTPLARHKEPWETIVTSIEALDAAQWEHMQTGRLSEHFWAKSDYVRRPIAVMEVVDHLGLGEFNHIVHKNSPFMSTWILPPAGPPDSLDMPTSFKIHFVMSVLFNCFCEKYPLILEVCITLLALL